MILKTDKSKKESGSITMEYIIISTFVLAISVAAITMVSKMFKERMERINDKLGLENEERITFDF